MEYPCNSVKEKSNGLIDWYDVLGIEDIQAETKIYNKLALRVHPDKNSTSLAAYGAYVQANKRYDACDILSEPLALARKSFDLRPNFTKQPSKSCNSGSYCSAEMCRKRKRCNFYCSATYCFMNLFR